MANQPIRKKENQSTQWPPRKPVCVGTVVLQGEKALLIRQARGHPLAGQWSVPWGMVETEETPSVAALRETEEESGICARIEGLLGVQELPEEGWIGIIYLCRHVSGFPFPGDPDEVDAASYFSLEEVNSFQEPLEPWSEWLVRRVLSKEFSYVLPVPDSPFQPRLAFFNTRGDLCRE